MHFSKQTRKLLERCGWFPNRQVNIDDLQAAMEQSGFDLAPPMEAFFKQFSGLECYESDGRMRFDLFIRLGWLRRAKNNALTSNLVGEPALSAGLFRNSMAEVLIGASGKLYGLSEDNDIYFLGHDMVEDMEFICQHGLSENQAIFDHIMQRWQSGSTHRQKP